MITGYTRPQPKKQATNKQIRTTIYNALINAEHIGLKTMDCQLLIQHVCEHLDELRLTYTPQTVMRCLDEMLAEDNLYRVSNDDRWRIGRTEK